MQVTLKVPGQRQTSASMADIIDVFHKNIWIKCLRINNLIICLHTLQPCYCGKNLMAIYFLI